MVFEFICKDFDEYGEVAKPKSSVAEESLCGTFPPVKAFKTVHAARCFAFFLPRNCWQNVFLLLFTFQWTKGRSRNPGRRSKLPDYLAFNLTVSFKRGDAQHHWTLMQITWWEMALSCVAKLKWMLSQSWSQGGCMTSHWCCSDAPLKVLDGMYDAHESSVCEGSAERKRLLSSSEWCMNTRNVMPQNALLQHVDLAKGQSQWQKTSLGEAILNSI